MGDVADILGVRGEKDRAALTKPKVAKVKKPKGMSREVFALIGEELPPIVSLRICPF